LEGDRIMKIQEGKYYKTKGGDKAFIYTDSAPDSKYPIHGRLEIAGGNLDSDHTTVYSWMACGRANDYDSYDDIVAEWAETKPRMLAYTPKEGGVVLMYPEGDPLPKNYAYFRMPHLDEPEEK
jgi:hypothetical protein